LWETRIKRHIKAMRGMGIDRLGAYLDEYMRRSWVFPAKPTSGQFMAGVVVAF
ncbi:hypothetical protein L914_03922, partial [Phytophthora nicotianae]